MPIELQARDLKVLKFVFENRIADYDQVMKLAFDNGKRSIVSRRITALTKYGYLKKISILREEKPGIGLLPTEKGFKAIRESWKYEVENPLYKTESPYHDLHLGDLRFCFEKLRYYQDFYPENLLQGFEDVPNDPALGQLKLICADGALLLKHEDGTEFVFGVELELSKKNINRYISKLKQYHYASGLDGILYICSNQEIINLIEKADESACTS